MKDNDRDVNELMANALKLINSMGEMAIAFYGKGRPGVKFDESLVTEAELQLRKRFDSELSMIYPEHRLFDDRDGQDGEYTHEDKRYVWVLDALDGVANFQGGIPIWGISLALLENNWPVLGVFHMPATGDVFSAAAGGPALWNGNRLPEIENATINDESVLLINSRFHRRYRTEFPGKIMNLGCSGAHMCYVATGRAEGAVIFNESYSGLAAAAVIGEASGVGIYRMNGSEFSSTGYPDDVRIGESLLVAPKGVSEEIINCFEELG